jgi:hypothetical protein
VNVYVVEAKGIYNQGIHLVSNTLSEAQAFTDNFSPDTDGYHDWLITEHVLGQVEGKMYDKHPKTKVEGP